MLSGNLSHVDVREPFDPTHSLQYNRRTAGSHGQAAPQKKDKIFLKKA